MRKNRNKYFGYFAKKGLENRRNAIEGKKYRKINKSLRKRI